VAVTRQIKLSLAQVCLCVWFYSSWWESGIWA